MGAPSGRGPQARVSSDAPLLFLPYQQECVGDTSPVVVIEKSRRIGISWAWAGNSAIEAGSASGSDVWYIGYNKEMAREFIRDCGDWTRALNLAAGEIGEEMIEDEDGDILSYAIRYSSGKRVTALSSRPASLRGKQGWFILDEAAFHDDLAGLMKAALASLMWGGRVIVISTHNGVDSEFNELLIRIKRGDVDYSLHTVTIDDALDQGLFKRICLARGVEWSAEREAKWLADMINFYGIDADEELRCIPKQRIAGQHMRREWLTFVDEPPADIIAVVRGHDLAGTEAPTKTKSKRGPDWTRSVKIGKTRSRKLVVLHGCGIQGEPGAVEEYYKRVAREDGHDVTQCFWQDPGQAGKDQARIIKRNLAGYHVQTKVARSDKLTYAGPFSSEAFRGNVIVVNGPWVESWLREWEAFPPPKDKGHDDWPDATSRAEIALRGRGFGTPRVKSSGEKRYWA